MSQLGDGLGRGVQLHNCLMVDAATKLVVGNVGSKLNYRQKVSKSESRTARLKRYRESEVWGDVVELVGAPPKGTQWIHIFDRGGDNFEAMCHIIRNNGDWLIRAAKLNRIVQDSEGNERSRTVAPRSPGTERPRCEDRSPDVRNPNSAAALSKSVRQNLWRGIDCDQRPDRARGQGSEKYHADLLDSVDQPSRQHVRSGVGSHRVL